MAEAKDDKKDKAAAKKPLDMQLIMTLAFAVVNLGVIGFGAFLTYKSTLGWKPIEITEEQLAKDRQGEKQTEESAPLLYTMDKFTVNLDGEPKRTIRIEVNLEMLGKEGFEEVITNDTRVRARDKIVRLLNDKNFSEIESIQGKLFLKDRIAFEINNILDTGVVKDVYFSEFVVQ